ncbi:MAG: hypothetical protein Q8R35_00535 [bacterium]|nr:hypothetical protein [bacterium]
MSFNRVLHEHRGAYWVVAAAGFFGAVILIFIQNESFYRDFLSYSRIPPSPPAGAFHTARITIDFGNGTKRAFEGAPGDGMTILSALRLAEEAGQFSVRTDSVGNITTVAGVRNGGGKRWRAYRNAAPVSDLPGHIEVRAGDRILLAYE